MKNALGSLRRDLRSGFREPCRLPVTNPRLVPCSLATIIDFRRGGYLTAGTLRRMDRTTEDLSPPGR
jgi:hypothetical protein